MRPQDIPPHLHDRYGIRPPSPWRWVIWAAALIVLLPIGIYSGARFATSQQQPYAVISWSANAIDTAVAITFRTRSSTTATWCALRAQDWERFDVGFAVVPVAAGTTSTSFDLAITKHPIAVEIVGCDADPYALPGPQFRPGQLPPAQSPPALAPGVYTREALRALQ